MESRLEAWFEEAKSSLSVAGPICNEANAFLYACRHKLERASIIWAQTKFLYDSINSQLQVLKVIVQSWRSVSESQSKDTDESVKILDENHSHLAGALKSLEATALDKSLASSGSSDANLKSFVDEEVIASLKNVASETIARTRDRETRLTATISEFSDNIRHLQDSFLADKGLDVKELGIADENVETVAGHAHSMAVLLESLTRHFDQCSEAIELFRNGPQGANQQDDLDELVLILDRDSKQVEDVVAELYERREAIEACVKFVQSLLNDSVVSYEKTVKFFELIDTFGADKVPIYTRSIEITITEHQSCETNIKLLVKEIASLVEYYKRFLQSYHLMILEIVRRRKDYSRLQLVADEIQKKLHRMYQEEVNQRQHFLKETGDYLPSNLWAGLDDSPVKLELSMTSSPLQLPDLDSESINQAIKHLRL